MEHSNREPNRLINEKSPYLLQHAYNPVDWHPWNDDTFIKAKQENKPIFLSIGYSTCHWCHVMERESFEDEEVAEILNKNFISVKVDREERPDVDHIYMTTCQALTGHGGWPLTIIMTADKKPFFAGTYFPKKSRMGMYSIMDLLNSIIEAWKERKDELLNSSDRIFEHLQDSFMVTKSNAEIRVDSIEKMYSYLSRAFDSQHGGFGSAPKFPTSHNLLFLLRYWSQHKDQQALKMVEKTLDSMYRGGIYDHIGFGFSRYSTDNKWLVPHFEKMLYDNALISIAYLEAFQATGKEEYRRVAEQIFTYILRDMTSPEGGFYSAEDADSEGVEGKYYVWEPHEVRQVLGEEAAEKYCYYYDITEEGNFEGKSIPNLIKADQGILKEIPLMDEQRRMLFQSREARVHPYKDDKILTSWNGLMIAALSIGGRVLGDRRLVGAADKALDFILKSLCRQDGRLLARYRDSESSYLGYVDDYAFLIWGLIELYETTYNTMYLEKALEFNEGLIKYFWDEDNGGLFYYGSDGEQLLARPKEIYDGAMPSGNSVAASNFLRLARMTGDIKLEERAQEQLRCFGQKINEAPVGYGYFLSAYMFNAYPSKEIIIIGDKGKKDTEDMLSVMNKKYIPLSVSILFNPEDNEGILQKVAPFLKDYKRVDNKATAYICENYTCKAPITDTELFTECIST